MTGRSTIRRLLVAACATLLAVAGSAALPAAPAWAHSKLIGTDPAKGSTVTAPFTVLTLTFDEMVRQSRTVVTVTGPDGVSYSDGAARVVDKKVLQSVKPLPQGAITVTWTSAAPDGDAISGTFAFTSAVPAPTSAAPSPSAAEPAVSTTVSTSVSTAAALPAPQPAAGEQGSDSALSWVLGVVAVLLIAGGGWLWTRRRPRT